jgi:hypothetical protein
MAVDVVALSAAITGVVSSQPASHKPNPATIIPFRSVFIFFLFQTINNLSLFSLVSVDFQTFYNSRAGDSSIKREKLKKKTLFSSCRTSPADGLILGMV